MKKSMLLSAAACLQLVAQDAIEEIRVEDTVISKMERTGTLKNVIETTYVVTEKEIQKKQASTLSEAIDNEPGIRVATGCSMCGMKRIQINGLKGEHTTVLVDDVPMHSTVSSYYGMDALTMAGVASIEVARGSGASLIAPGAIGGVVNIKTKRAEKNQIFIDTAVGNDDYRLLSIVGTGVSEDGRSWGSVSAQYSNQGQWDADNNGINESPSLENNAVTARFSHDLTDSDNIDIKITAQKSDVFGGPMTNNHQGALQDDGDASFVDNDVRKDYNGAQLATLEAITTNREELIAKWTHQINDESNFIITASGADQVQESNYEGDDYYGSDRTYYTDVRYNALLSDEHFLTVGADSKQEKMDASSKALFEVRGLTQDDFDMSSYGLYVQDIYTPTDNLEISMALRADKIAVNWTDQTTKENEIDETVLVPRVHIKWSHNAELVSRFSVGQGYRAPLTFFESEHGIIGDDGFGMDIKDIEKSNAVNYALSYDNERFSSTASAAWTQIENLAYINEDDYAKPTLTSKQERLNTYAFDVVAGYQLIDALSIGAGYEHFIYDDEYKVLQTVALIEDRARVMLDYEESSWAFNTTLTWIGSRDLSEYGYIAYNKNDGGNLSDKKSTDAPAYATVDMKLSKELNKNYSAYVGVKNLFDYTQAGDEDTPLMWDEDGGYDVGYIYGPLRGRQLYVGLSARF